MPLHPPKVDEEKGQYLKDKVHKGQYLTPSRLQASAKAA
jgi:hypothetical protein